MSSKWSQRLHAVSGAFVNKPNVDDGGKIILPNSAMMELAHTQVMFPMMFQVRNGGRYTHVGVLEFTADEGQAVLPFWMMQFLGLNPFDKIVIVNVGLQKGKFVRIRPQSKAFIETSNPKAVLEAVLRHFTCLTRGDSIPVKVGGTTHIIDVTDVKSIDNNPNTEAVCIVEADVSVDFERPLDMPESPTRPPQSEKVEEHVEQPPKVEDPFKGAGKSLSGAVKQQPQQQQQPSSSSNNSTSVFPVTGRTLRGVVKTEPKQPQPQPVSTKQRGSTPPPQQTTPPPTPPTPLPPPTTASVSSHVFFPPQTLKGNSNIDLNLDPSQLNALPVGGVGIIKPPPKGRSLKS